MISHRGEDVMLLMKGLLHFIGTQDLLSVALQIPLDSLFVRFVPFLFVWQGSYLPVLYSLPHGLFIQNHSLQKGRIL